MVNKKDLRGGIEKMREVAQLLSGWADDMESSLEAKEKKTAADAPSAAEAAPAGKVAPAPSADAAPAAPAELPEAESVRTVLAAKCAAGFRTQVQALINSFGAAKFSEVAPEHYPALLEAVAGLGGDPDAG